MGFLILFCLSPAISRQSPSNIPRHAHPYSLLKASSATQPHSPRGKPSLWIRQIDLHAKTQQHTTQHTPYIVHLADTKRRRSCITGHKHQQPPRTTAIHEQDTQHQALQNTTGGVPSCTRQIKPPLSSYFTTNPVVPTQPTHPPGERCRYRSRS